MISFIDPQGEQFCTDNDHKSIRELITTTSYLESHAYNGDFLPYLHRYHTNATILRYQLSPHIHT